MLNWILLTNKTLCILEISPCHQVCAWNPKTWEAEAKGSLGIKGQSEAFTFSPFNRRFVISGFYQIEIRSFCTYSRFLFWMDIGFYQRLLEHPLRWTYDFCLCFCLWEVLYLLNYTCRTILLSLDEGYLVIMYGFLHSVYHIFLRILVSVFIKQMGL